MNFKRTTVLSVGFAAFLLGLGFARTGWLLSLELVISLGIFFLVTVSRLRALALLSAVLFLFSLGWWRGQQFLVEAHRLEALSGAKVTMQVRAENDGVYDERGQLSFDGNEIVVIKPYLGELPGKVAVGGFGEPAVFKGDTIELTGRVYKRRGARQVGVSFASMEVVSRQQNWIDNLRRKFAAGLFSSVPEPQASFGLGLLVGQRNTLPDAVIDQLSQVGLTHIIAVSGYNLTIIVSGVRRLLHNRSKYQSTLVSAALIITFLLMTGMSASIVRAAIISGLSILAWYYGRTFKPVLLLLMTAALTAGWNPFYLWADIGWYLSFLAFFGVLVLAPLLQKRLLAERKLGLVQGVMLESFAAFIMTAPLILFIFKQLSLIALPANLAIVPLVPLAMLFSLLAGLAGAVLPTLAASIAWPAVWLLTAMLDIVQLLSRVPHILLERGINLMGMGLLYTLLLAVTVILWKKTVQNDRITDINME